MATSRSEAFFRKANWEQAHESQGYEATDLITALTTRAELEHSSSQVKVICPMDNPQCDDLRAVKIHKLVGLTLIGCIWHPRLSGSQPSHHFDQRPLILRPSKMYFH